MTTINNLRLVMCGDRMRLRVCNVAGWSLTTPSGMYWRVAVVGRHAATPPEHRLNTSILSWLSPAPIESWL